MAGESAQEKADDFAARRRRARADLGYLPLALVVAGLVLLGAVVAELTIGAWWIGALLMAVVAVSPLGPSQQEVAWQRGAEGERIVGGALDRLTGNGVYALHDRRMPRSRANIDHLLVGPAGVVTVDAKRYRGKLESRGRARELWVGGRNRSKLLVQAQGQADAVRETLAASGLSAPVRPALCFVGVEWPLLFAPREIAGVQLVSPRRLRRLLTGPAVLDGPSAERIASRLEQALPPASRGDGSRPGGRPAVPRPPRPRGPAPRPATPQAEAPRPDPAPDAAQGDALEITRWKRYGHDRLYANLADGRTAAYIDVPTGRVAIELAEYAESVTSRLEAARAALQR